MGLIWLFAALGNSLFAAANAEINRKFQQEPYRLNMLRTTLASVIWLPLAMIQPWPEDRMFYTAAVFTGIAIVFGNIVLNGLSARLNGRVAALHIPMKAIAVFTVWPLLDDAAWQHITQEQPWQVVTGLLFFAIMVAAINAMRRNDASWGAVRELLPVVMFYTASDLIARSFLDDGEFGSRLIVYLFVAMSVSALFSLLIMPWRPRPELPLVNKRLLQAAGWAAIFSVLNHLCFFIGLVLAPNPAYVSMIALIAPAWLLLYHRLFNIRDDASPWASMILVLGAIGLLLVTH